MEKQLYEALKYAYELLLDQAETGHYPLKALTENGGKGYEPIQAAIKACESPKGDIGENNSTIRSISESVITEIDKRAHDCTHKIDVVGNTNEQNIIAEAKRDAFDEALTIIMKHFR